MTKIQRSALVPYSAVAMYQLVNDIEAYPDYMDGCVGATVLQRTPDTMEARLDLAKGGMRYSFTTRNRLLPSRIELTLVEGPFEKFRGEWDFLELNAAACKITLHLDFKMSSRVLNFAARKMFDGIANQMVDAMVKQAHKRFGSAR